MSTFGPEYPKIQTVFRRDERNVIVPGAWTLREFEYLADIAWRWTEKIDGTNIRLHWDGERVTVGGRTDNAQVPSPLVANLAPQLDASVWREAFPDSDDVTVYGEGYGAKIQSGGMYRPDQALVVFDVLVGRWWLQDDDIADVTAKLGLELVPQLGHYALSVVIHDLPAGEFQSQWPNARIEGLVGRPAVDLFNRRGDRIITKVKVKDWADLARREAPPSSSAATTRTPTP